MISIACLRYWAYTKLRTESVKSDSFTSTADNLASSLVKPEAAVASGTAPKIRLMSKLLAVLIAAVGSNIWPFCRCGLEVFASLRYKLSEPLPPHASVFVVLCTE